VHPMFQSHNGAIAALSEVFGWDGVTSGFNPTMVRLLPLRSANSSLSPQVSIPQWCDCCKGVINDGNSWSNVSIPQWCDCCEEQVTAKDWARFVSIPQWCDCCLIGNRLRLQHARQFQSHNGAIAAKPFPTICSLCRLFQSHNGAIAARVFVCIDHQLERVSIPQWCDCCWVKFPDVG